MDQYDPRLHRVRARDILLAWAMVAVFLAVLLVLL